MNEDGLPLPSANSKKRQWLNATDSEDISPRRVKRPACRDSSLCEVLRDSPGPTPDLRPTGIKSKAASAGTVNKICDPRTEGQPSKARSLGIPDKDTSSALQRQWNETANVATLKPVPSESPRRLPLTTENLHLLNQSRASEDCESSTMTSDVSDSATASAPAGSINAYSDEYEGALKQREVFFFDAQWHATPPGLEALWQTVSKARDGDEPTMSDAEALFRDMLQGKNESATVEAVCPKIIPFETLRADKNAAVAANEKWRPPLGLMPELTPKLTPPKPDHTIGWNSKVFEDFKKACKALGVWFCPVSGNTDVSWPLFTAESKGSKGRMRVARRQNLYNAAVMLSNLIALKEMAENKPATAINESFFNKIHVMTMELSDENAQLSCYWATRSTSGVIRYFGKSLQIWALRDRTGVSYKEACRCVQNAMDLVKSQAIDWIRADMATIEAIYAATDYSKVKLSKPMSSRYRVHKKPKTRGSKSNPESSVPTSQRSEQATAEND